MYSIENFTPYPPLRKHLGSAVCLVWSRANGYQFMTILDRFKAIGNSLDFKIVGAEK